MSLSNACAVLRLITALTTCVAASIATAQSETNADPVWVPGLSIPLSERVAYDPGPYSYGPDSKTQPGVPAGTVTEHRFNQSKVFPTTDREYWVYVPKQYGGQTPAALMVFQDGHAYLGRFKAATVLDNLIHEGAIPVTIAVFVEPGHRLAAPQDQIPDQHWDRRNNRRIEYNVVDDAYARFLIDELLPTALAGYTITDDPARRMIAGISSGGICALNAAWHRPDAFGKVLTSVGSFTNIRGAHHLQAMIRKGPNKGLRIHMQDGMKDLDNVHGNWYLANQAMASTLALVGYDYRFVVGSEGHSNKQESAVFPEAVRWLFHDWDGQERHIPMPPVPTTKQLPAELADQPAGVSIPLNDRVIFEPGPYQPGTDFNKQPNTPQGTIHEHAFNSSKIYPNTQRQYWVYIPKQYDEKKPAALMVFQDGAKMLNPKQFNGATIMDNLIAQGDMPVTIGVFINPGNNPAIKRKAKNRFSNRSIEYDTPDGTYAEFLLTEILPQVVKDHKLNISANPAMRGLCGTSSGGICAFKCAWHHPESFGKVVSFIGSFTNIRGGHDYQAQVRKGPAESLDPYGKHTAHPRKDIRVFLQDGIHDVNNQHGNWFISNQQMAMSLAFQDYDYRFVIGDGGHNGLHTRQLLPDALRWAWRD